MTSLVNNIFRGDWGSCLNWGESPPRMVCNWPVTSTPRCLLLCAPDLPQFFTDIAPGSYIHLRANNSVHNKSTDKFGCHDLTVRLWNGWSVENWDINNNLHRKRRRRYFNGHRILQCHRSLRHKFLFESLLWLPWSFCLQKTGNGDKLQLISCHISESWPMMTILTTLPPYSNNNFMDLYYACASKAEYARTVANKI